MSLALLRQQLAEVVAPAAPTTRALPTGLAELDAILPSGGLPRGRLTELLGARGSGKTTILRELVAETLSRGEWVAYVDASRTLAARDWAGHRDSGFGIRDSQRLVGERPALHEPLRIPNPESRIPMWIIRPNEISKSAWCADILLRSGAFGLVILDGAPPLTRAVAARLVRLARESDAAFVVTGEENARAAALPAALLLRVERARRPRRTPPQSRTRPVVITVERGAGRRRAVEVNHVVRVADRLSTHSEVADRRGVERAGAAAAHNERSGTHDPTRAPAPPVAPHRDLGKRRRCAEPDYERPSAERKRRARAGTAGMG